MPAGVVCTLYALCTYIQPVEHGRFTIPVEHDSGTRINTRTPHYVLLLQVQVSGFWMLDSWGFAGSPRWGFCRSARVWVMTAASYPSPRILHPASCIPKLFCNLVAVASLAQQASGFWVLGAGKLQAVQPSCTKSTLVLVYSFGTLHRGGVACRQSVSTMLAVVVLVQLLGSQ